MRSLLRWVTAAMVVVVLAASSLVTSLDLVETVRDIELRINKYIPSEKEEYACTGMKFEGDNYIVRFEALNEQHMAHHMILFGCKDPSKSEGFWICGDMGGACAPGSPSQILFSWSHGGSPLQLPKDVSFHVGGSTDLKYAVLQVHYAASNGHNVSDDSSGMKITMLSQPTGKDAGVLILAYGGLPIPPLKQRANTDVGCDFLNPMTIHPFAFRTHAHRLGTSIRGYRVRNGIFHLIGEQSPQNPQTFYPIGHDIPIKLGDQLAARCTYDTTSKRTFTHIGGTSKDEMCNFYIMYWAEKADLSENGYPQCYMLQDETLLQHFPPNSDAPFVPPEGSNMPPAMHHGGPIGADHEMAAEPAVDNSQPPWLKELQEMSKSGFKLEPSHRILFTEAQAQTLGIKQISGMDVDSAGTLVVFSRGSRVWDSSTFGFDHKLVDKTTIPDPALLWIHPKTGEVLRKEGRNSFYLPHGITIDQQDNIWLTDVGAHQVYKFNKDMVLLLTLGKLLTPGSGRQHFCKPTDVAVNADRSFYVSDGYCNSRILFYNPQGSLQDIYGESLNMIIPHSLSLDETAGLLYVADRENAIVYVMDSTGTIRNTIRGLGDSIYAVALNKPKKLMYTLSNIHRLSPHMITYNLETEKVTQSWGPQGGLSSIHDLAVDQNKQQAFVLELNPVRIWKRTLTCDKC